MCGITGFTGKKDDELINKMLDTIIHRGPDDFGYYSDDQVTIGMRRLSIIDLTSGKQPIHNEDKTIWTVFNGEIYNYVELRKELEQRGNHKFYTNSDTEVFLHLYEDEGIDFTHKLNGMFGIAIWDTNKEHLILIRDRMGVKPLFYTFCNGKLIFGSEIKTILAHPDYHKEMNYEALYHYLSLRNIPAPLTAFKNIYTLKPGERLIYTPKTGNAVFEKWYTVDFSKNTNLEEPEIKENILTILKDAVRLRMRSDVPYGSYLSGGVDSSTVAAIMTNFSDQPIKTFCLGYEDQFQYKEADLHHARKLHKLYNTEHYEYIMSHDEVIDNALDIIKSFDQPFSGTSSTFFLSKLICKHVKVALSGDAADEVFASYLSHRLANPMHHFARMYDKYKANELTDEDKKLFLPCDLKFLERLYEGSQGNQVDWRYMLYIFPDKEKQSLLTPQFANNNSTYSLIQEYFKDLTATDPLNRILEMEINTQLPDQVLSYIDILSMAHSIEVRSPFIDYRLVEFAATIPGYLKIKNGVVKDILKESLDSVIPQEIINRAKEGFVLPIYDWMNEKFKNYSYDVLSENKLNKFNLVKPDKVKEILANHYSGKDKQPAKIWTLINLQLWSEEYFT